MKNIIIGLLLLMPFYSYSEKLKEIATIEGVRDNKLVGYGLIVGLDGTGDSGTAYTQQSMLNMLNQMGVSLPQGLTLQTKNVAAVSITATLPAFAKQGQNIDVQIASIANAKSLKNGTLLMSMLKGVDGQIYAVAQGQVSVLSGEKNTQSASGVVINGASVEREPINNWLEKETVRVSLKEADFAALNSVIKAINSAFGSDIANAENGRTIEVKLPLLKNQKIDFISTLLNLEIKEGKPKIKIIVNTKSGGVVSSEEVPVGDCTISYGKFVLNIKNKTMKKTETKETTADINSSGDVKLSEVLKALSAMGLTNTDVVNIIQALKTAGALNAEIIQL